MTPIQTARCPTHKQVDICNMTLAIEGLERASYKSPAWLPKYPAKQSFKAGTYFPFTVILPVDPGSLSAYSYPSVDVVKGFFACDAALKQLPEDQVVPPPGTGRSSIEADDDYPGSGPKSGLNSKIKWNTGFLASAGSNTDCLGGCLGTLNKQTDDCLGACVLVCGSGDRSIFLFPEPDATIILTMQMGGTEFSVEGMRCAFIDSTNL